MASATKKTGSSQSSQYWTNECRGKSGGGSGCLVRQRGMINELVGNGFYIIAEGVMKGVIIG